MNIINVQPADVDKIYEELRLHAARAAWKKDRLAEKGEGPHPERFSSWAEWWTDLFGDGETFHQYTTRKRSEK